MRDYLGGEVLLLPWLKVQFFPQKYDLHWLNKNAVLYARGRMFCSKELLFF